MAARQLRKIRVNSPSSEMHTEVTEDVDIWRAAKLLVDRYGDTAHIHAAMRADELMVEGDLDGRRIGWRSRERSQSCFGGVKTMSRYTEIKLGQRFRDAGPTAFGVPSRTEWIVDRLWSVRSGIRHARLVQAADRARIKVISTAALADRKLYVLTESGFEVGSSASIEERGGGESLPRSISL